MTGRGFDRWTYLQDGRPRVGRGRHLFDYFELGSRVELALETENSGPAGLVVSILRERGAGGRW